MSLGEETSVLDRARGQGELLRTEGGPAQTDDTCRGVLQPGQRTGNPGLLDYTDEETGRKE